MSISEFKEWINKIYNHFILCSTTIPEGSTSEANADGNSDSPNNFMSYP